MTDRRPLIAGYLTMNLCGSPRLRPVRQLIHGVDEADGLLIPLSPCAAPSGLHRRLCDDPTAPSRHRRAVDIDYPPTHTKPTEKENPR